MKKHDSRNQQRQQKVLSWQRLMLRKWLNTAASISDYSADIQTGSDSDSETEFCDSPKGDSRLKNARPDGIQVDANVLKALPRLRRRKSETFRAQYINRKEIRICAGTWNVGGKVPSDDLDLAGWLNIDDPSDIYVIGLQEIIPLSAGNVLGAEDSRPVSKWEKMIREILNRVPPVNKFKCYSDPVSPSRFKPSEDAPHIDDVIVLESDSDAEEGISPLNEESDIIYESDDRMLKEPNFLCEDVSVSIDDENRSCSLEQKLKPRFSSPKEVDGVNCLKTQNFDENKGGPYSQYTSKLTKSLSVKERIGLSWPEPALHLLPHVLERPNSIKTSKSFNTSKSFRAYSSVKSNRITENRMPPDLQWIAELDLESLLNRKRRPPFVRIISKQMVGIFITIWVRRSLRRHVQNLNLSTVGVGIMGYIGNKGSISVSMSIYQTLFCFVCTHLPSGEKDADALRRNAVVRQLHRRTRFNTVFSLGLPKRIYDHERIIWLGDLNYRINLSYEKTRELISKKNWSELAERDQLIKELKKARAFDGWSEGTLTFAPTYKFEVNSESYRGEDSTKPGRRTPAWCDRILSFGIGIKLISYRRTELKLSDHRPVAATYMVDVEVFSPRKLQQALTFTDAEIQESDIITDIGVLRI